MANFSQINAVSGGQVKTADDLWLVRGGVLVPAIEAWAVKSGALVKVWERYGGATTMAWGEPTAGQYNVNTSTPWTVTVAQGIHLVKPKGRVKFTWTDGHVEYGDINDSGGAAASRTFTTAGVKSCTATLESTNGFTAAPVTRETTVVGGTTSISFTAPSWDQVYYGPTNVTWQVYVNRINNVVPVGTIRFNGPQGARDVALDANGYASTTYSHGSGQRTVTADLITSTNGYTAPQASHRIRLLINTRYQQTEYYTNAGHRNYAGPNGGPQSSSAAISGDNSSDGKSWRAFTLVNRPAKPQSDASCVAASAVYTVSLAAAGVRVGYHTLGGFPATGTFAAAGVYQNLVTGSGSTGEHWVDIGLHVAAAINNDTLRGLVFGGPTGSTPYNWVNSANYMGLVVVWEWWRWIDT